MKMEVIFEKGDYQKDGIYASDGIKMKVLEKPYRKWYQVLFEILSFRIYRAGYYYLVEIDGNDGER